MTAARAIDIAAAVRAGELSAVDVVDSALTRVEELNPALNAFVYVDAESARRIARDIDRRARAGDDPGPLAGVPFGIKDLDDCAGMPTALGSAVYRDRRPALRDAISVERLRHAGAIPIGKTAIPELTADLRTVSPAFGVTRNPWNHERTPGGSSGGSAAAVASGMVPLATGTDSGGSIRNPAALCGLVGMKPSYGRVPNTPVGPFTCAGALVACVEDAARYLDVVKGPDDRDWLSLPADPARYEPELGTVDLSGRRALWSELGYPVVDEQTHGLAQSTAQAVSDAVGLRLDSRADAPAGYAERSVYSTLRSLELWMLIDRETWRRRRTELAPVTVRCLEPGLERDTESLARAFEQRSEIAAAVAAVFASYDFLLTPSSLIPAYDATESGEGVTFDGRHVSPGPDPQLLLANVCGNPAVSVPAGVTRDGLPVGLQIVGRRHRDLDVLALAHAVQRARPWPRLPPALSGVL